MELTKSFRSTYCVGKFMLLTAWDALQRQYFPRFHAKRMMFFVLVSEISTIFGTSAQIFNLDPLALKYF
jgi:hypothetical protein